MTSRTLLLLAALLAPGATLAQAQIPPNPAPAGLSGTNTGDVTLTAVGSTPSANGASLSGQALTLQPASATQPGVVTTGTQTIAGNKTLSGSITLSTSGKLLGVWGGTPQFIDMGYASNGVQIRTASTGGGDFTVADAGGNLFLHSSVGGLTQGSVENPVPVFHVAKSSTPKAMEADRNAANGSGVLAVTFATAFTVAPACQCTDENATPAVCGVTTAPSTTGVTFYAGAARADTVGWFCIGTK